MKPSPLPAFEEMAEPEIAPVNAAPSPPAAQMAPLALTPRNLNTGPASVGRGTPAALQVPTLSPRPPVAVPPPTFLSAPVSLPAGPSVSGVGQERASAAAIGGKVVQLGAFRSHAEAEKKALGNWRRDVPTLFQRIAEPVIVTADLGEKGVFYRVRVAGFTDSRRASEFCGEYKGGGRDCYVVP